MTRVRFSNERYDRLAEYQALKTHDPAAARAVADAIQVIYEDPERAAKRYSVSLSRDSGYRAIPFVDSAGNKTCLVWRDYPDVDDETTRGT